MHGAHGAVAEGEAVGGGGGVAGAEFNVAEVDPQKWAKPREQAAHPAGRRGRIPCGGPRCRVPAVGRGDAPRPRRPKRLLGLLVARGRAEDLRMRGG